MKITPLEIRQKDFTKTFRGYEKDEVDAFLQSLSQQWEKILDENKELSLRLEAAQKEVEKLREVESSLFKTLKTAEDTGANLVEQANKTAELHLKETEMKAQALVSEAKSKAKNTIEDAEETARRTLQHLEEELKELVKNYKQIESYRDNLVDDLSAVAKETLEKIRRAGDKMNKFDVEAFMKKAKNIIQAGPESPSRNDQLVSEKKETALPNEKAFVKEITHEPDAADQDKGAKASSKINEDKPTKPEVVKPGSKSFFDEV